MQSTIEVTARQIRALEGPYLQWVKGNEDAKARGVSSPSQMLKNSLAFVASKEFLMTAANEASILIVEERIKTEGFELTPQQALFRTPSLKAGMAVALSLFDPRNQIQDSLISPQAHVHPTAKIGEGTRIEAGAFVGAGAVIGKDCLLYSNSVVQAFCQIGDRCILHSMAVIGADGFGFIADPNGRHHKIPQIGTVVIGNDVEIGACTTVDRATIGETRIGDGCKFDDHCHVAHNVIIGKHGVFAGSFMIAGSSEIGDHFMGGGSSVVSDHVKICDRVVIGGRSGVTKDITQPGMYTGYPLEPFREGLKTLQNLRQLTKLRQQVNLMSKRLGMAEDQE